MKIKVLLLFILSFLSVASYGESVEQQATREAVYVCEDQCFEGQIGKAHVTLMLGDFDSTPFGVYYYGASVANLILKPNESVANQWKEFDESGKLTGLLAIVRTDDEVIGTWTSPGGKTHLPVNLKASQEGFSSRRLKEMKTFVMNNKTIGAHAYQTFTMPGLGSSYGLRLTGNAPSIRQINLTLYKQFLDFAEALLDCRAKGLAIENQNYEESFGFEIAAWNTGFVMVRFQNEGYCGQAHPYSSSNHVSYSIRTGQKEDMTLWLAEEYREQIPLTSGLGKILSHAYIRERSKSAPNEARKCLRASNFSGSDMVPSASGIVFTNSVPYAWSPCEEHFTIPYQMMQPFLSSMGKENSLFFKMDGSGVRR